MNQHRLQAMGWCALMAVASVTSGCAGTHPFFGFGRTDNNATCGTAGDCDSAGNGGHAHSPLCNGCCLWMTGQSRSMAIPDVQPLGSVNRAHYHTMQTNGEAADFIFYRSDFVGNTAELTPAGKDHVLEVGARMRSTPFPVLVERSQNNADPELDAHRRNVVAHILTDLGNPDAQQRTFVSQPYGRSPNSQEAEMDYYRFLYSRGSSGNGFGNNNFNNGFGGNNGNFGF